MPTTWGQVKEEFRDGFRDGTQAFISDLELLRMLRRVLRLIDNPEAYTFQQVEYTLTLTGATQYDLDTLIPGWKRIFTITNSLGVNVGLPLELEFVDMKDFQMTLNRYAYSIYQNRYLRVYSPTSSPLSGFLNVLYFSTYLVKDASTGAFKAIPTSDDDYFALPERWMDTITEGLQWLAFRKDRSNKEDAADAKSAFGARLMELITQETIQVQSPNRSMMGAF